VGINLEGVEAPVWRERAVFFVNKVLGTLGKDNWDISILLCDNAYIRGLNVRYRCIDEATDVLSFVLGEEAEESGEKRWLPGDIVISLDALEENARYFKVSPDEELRRLLIHGILHLDGMDHKGNDPEEPMLKKQEALLAGLSDDKIIGEKAAGS
jgi:probable rRNA maturation factor